MVLLKLAGALSHMNELFNENCVGTVSSHKL